MPVPRNGGYSYYHRYLATYHRRFPSRQEGQAEQLGGGQLYQLQENVRVGAQAPGTR
jgi:hypothetical protein